MTFQLASEFTQVSLAHFIIFSALLFVVGLAGFLTRRNLIVMFLCTELMFQAALVAFVAFGRYWFNYSGQVFVIFILTVAAAEAAHDICIVASDTVDVLVDVMEREGVVFGFEQAAQIIVQ